MTGIAPSFSPVWVSSVEHLERFTNIWKKASKAQRAFGSYEIPPEFPHVRMWWGLFPFFRGPLVFYSSGRLTANDALVFEAEPRPALLRAFGNVEVGLRLPWSFSLERSNVTEIRAYQVPEPFLAFFTLPWVQVYSARSTSAPTDLLLAIGGNVPVMGRLRQQNAELLTALETWRATE